MGGKQFIIELHDGSKFFGGRFDHKDSYYGQITDELFQAMRDFNKLGLHKNYSD